MAVYQRKSGVYYVQFYHNGKTFIKSTGCKNKAKAIQLEAKMRQDIFDAEVLGNPQEISLHDAAQLYLEKCKKQTRYATMCSTYK
jgi:hypothetical protein